MKHNGFEAVDKKPFILATFRLALDPSAERFESWSKTKEKKKTMETQVFCNVKPKKPKRPMKNNGFEAIDKKAFVLDTFRLAASRWVAC